jgi:hypothetical protein
MLLPRPLFILHLSLVIREYHGKNHETIEVADLRHRTPETLLPGSRTEHQRLAGDVTERVVLDR